MITKGQDVLYREEKYTVLDVKGEFATICNGDYAHFGGGAITIRVNELIEI